MPYRFVAAETSVGWRLKIYFCPNVSNVAFGEIEFRCELPNSDDA
jgi:hypothetical protein